MQYFISRFILSIMSLVCWASVVDCQQSVLGQKLEGKDKLDEIMEIVDQHYAEIASDIRDQTDEQPYKHWARWAWYMSARTDAEGRLVDVQKRIRRAYHTYHSNQRTSVGNWSSIGPTAISGANASAVGIGRVDRIAFHPTDTSILYIGTPSGGLLKSTDSGSSWSFLTDNMPSTSVSGIVVSHDNPDKLYILTGDGDSNNGGFVGLSGYWRSSAGVFVSYDAGINWYPTAPLPIMGSYAGYQLIQDPVNANVLLAATTMGVYRTNDAGASWTQVLDEGTHEIKFRPGSSTYVYATQTGKFFRSLDGGLSWAQITNFDIPLANARTALAITNVQSNRVYLLSGWGPGDKGCTDIDDTFGGIYISYDLGASFTQVANSPNIVESCCDGINGRNQSSYDLALAVSPSGANRIIAGGISTWGSSTTGSTWNNVSAGRCSAYTSSTGFVHADVHDVEYHPFTGAVFLCTDGGLIKSTNDGQDWINLSDGIVASQIYHMAGTELAINNLMISLQDNGTRARGTNTTVWNQVTGADGFDCVYDGNNSTSGYLSANKVVFRFTNNGGNVVPLTDTTMDEFFPRVQTHNTNPSITFAGYSDIYKSTDAGATWTNVGVTGNWDIERCPDNNTRFYAAGGESSFATTGNMYRSDDTGGSWTVISGNIGYPISDLRITDIDVRSNASANVWITFGGFSDGEKVFVSYDSGDSWTNLSGSLPNVPVNAIQVDQNLNAYIGTDIGVFYRGVEMADWVPFWNDLPIVPVTDLELNEGDGTIRAATFGRGVWTSDTYSACITQLVLNANISGHKYYEVSNSITSPAILFGGSNTNVVFKAGNYIMLTQGFEVGAGNKFHAYTAPCGTAEPEE
jgi:hypothetical protein